MNRIQVEVARAGKPWSTWTAPAPDGATAEEMALADARRALTVMTAHFPDGPAAAPTDLTAEALDGPTSHDVFYAHQAMLAETDHLLGTQWPETPWTTDKVVKAGRALVRLAAGAIPGHRATTVILEIGPRLVSQSNGWIAFGLPVHLHTVEGEALRSLPDHLRTALLATTIAATLSGGAGFGKALGLELKASATLRATESAKLRGTAGADAAKVAALLRVLRLPDDADALQAAVAADAR